MNVLGVAGETTGGGHDVTAGAVAPVDALGATGTGNDHAVIDEGDLSRVVGVAGIVVFEATIDPGKVADTVGVFECPVVHRRSPSFEILVVDVVVAVVGDDNLDVVNLAGTCAGEAAILVGPAAVRTETPVDGHVGTIYVVRRQIGLAADNGDGSKFAKPILALAVPDTQVDEILVVQLGAQVDVIVPGLRISAADWR